MNNRTIMTKYIFKREFLEIKNYGFNSQMQLRRELVSQGRVLEKKIQNAAQRDKEMGNMKEDKRSEKQNETVKYMYNWCSRRRMKE